jgi:hypothetical protein
MPSRRVVELVGSQYYFLEHFDPACLLGYLVALESLPPSALLIENMVSKTGYPQSAFRSLTAHAENDPTHAAYLYGLLDDLPLKEEQQKAIGLNALHTVKALIQLIRLEILHDE